LYADWNNRDSLLVALTDFEKDLRANFKELKAFGISANQANFFLPPYEWYNKATVSRAKQMGLTTVNFTPGIRSNADYMTPDMPGYRSSDQIMNDLKLFETQDSNGLNGALVLIHLGTSPQRTDKLYLKLDEFLAYFKGKGYQFCKLGEQ
jgi:peptidoglycan/xylan/chitin deacetylase (PgdA/CDA1 family)